MKHLKYNLLNNVIDKIKNSTDKKNKFIKLIENIIIELSSNIILITDYEVTCKISQYYIDNDIPFSRNSNTYCIHTTFASYIYSITQSILLSLNYGEICSRGEYFISAVYMYTIIDELDKLFNEQQIHLNYCNPIENIQELFIGLLNNSVDDVKYSHLLLDKDDDNLNTNVDAKVDAKVDTLDTLNANVDAKVDAKVDTLDTLFANVDENIINDEFIEKHEIYNDELFTYTETDSDSDNEINKHLNLNWHHND